MSNRKTIDAWRKIINPNFKSSNDENSKDILVDGHNEESELDKRGVTPQEVFNPKKSVTLREDEWNVVHSAINLAFMTTGCQDNELGRVMDKLLNQL